MNFLHDRRLVALLRVAIGAVFLAAALPKLQDPEAFAKSVSNYHMVPVTVERVMALVLPPLELLVGVFLIVGIFDAGASLLAFAMMIVFTLAVGTALARGLDISCGCFDTQGGTKVGLGKILENLALTAAAARVAFGDRSFASVGSLLRRASSAVFAVVAIVFGASSGIASPAKSPTAAGSPSSTTPAPTAKSAPKPPPRGNVVESDVRNTLSTKPFLWRIERTPEAYLFGTIHLPDARVTKVPDLVQTAFTKSHVFVTEIPLDDTAQAEVAKESIRSGTETLAMLLPAAVRESSDRFLQGYGFSLAEFAPLEVYAFALQLPLLEYAAKPIRPLDAMLYDRAKQTNKKLVALETPAEQLAIFEALSRDEQVELLRVTLQDLLPSEKGTTHDKVDDLVRAYLSGEDQRLDEDLFGPMRKGGPLERRLLHEMLDVRNERLATRVVRDLASQKGSVVFYAIGAGHMVGSQGIVERLRREGMKVTRLTSSEVAGANAKK